VAEPALPQHARVVVIGVTRLRLVFPDGRIAVRDENVKSGRTTTISARADQ
jgi:hypothetical protein